MNILSQTFFSVLYQPLLNGLVLIYNFLGHDLGLAVFLLTLLVKLALHPLSVKGMRQQKALSALEPKMKEVRQKYKDDKTQQSRALMELYQKEQISPLSGCLPMIIQLPIIIALYKVFSSGLDANVLSTSLYSFVKNPGAISPMLFGLIALNNKVFVFILAILAALFQFWQLKISNPKKLTEKKTGFGQKDFAASMQKQSLFLFPAITFFVVWRVGAAVGLYWFFSVALSLAEQIIINKRYFKEKT